MRQIILDTETTGLSVVEGDRVIELGCVELINRQLTGRHLHRYFKVDRESAPDALRVHGITSQFLSDKPRFEACAQEIIAFLSGAEIIIHNAPFDVAFLNNELQLAGLPPLQSHVAGITDSLLLAREVFPGKRNNLDALCDRFGIDTSSRSLHGALLDAQLLAQAYLYLTRGQNALLVDEKEEEEDVLDDLQTPQEDLSTFVLPIVYASADDLAAHEAILQTLDKTSGGKTLWRAAVVD